MKKDVVTLVSRALALVGLIALNAGLPAEAEAGDGCYSCFSSGGPTFCMGGSTAGHTYCEVHDNHCDQVGPCS